MNRFSLLNVESDDESQQQSPKYGKYQPPSRREPVVQANSQGNSRANSQANSQAPVTLRSRMMAKSDGAPSRRQRAVKQPTQPTEQLTLSDSNFPALSTRVGSSNVSGTWLRGVDPVRKAKDLPVPPKQCKKLDPILEAVCDGSDASDGESMSDCDEGEWEF